MSVLVGSGFGRSLYTNDAFGGIRFPCNRMFGSEYNRIYAGNIHIKTAVVTNTNFQLLARFINGICDIRERKGSIPTATVESCATIVTK